MLDPHSVLDALTSREPVTLDKLPNEYGVYALIDHTGQISYVGVTAVKNEGFKKRINGRHVTGTEGRSHKFSQAYNTGRMWRSREFRDSKDAKAAKRLRNLFCRKYCKAAYYTVPVISLGREYFRELEALEKRVKSIAPLPMRRWEGLHFAAEDEPKEMVDALIDELDYSAELREALTRQTVLFARSVSS